MRSRHSEVQRLLRDAAASQSDRPLRARSSEFDRLRDTIRLMRSDQSSNGYVHSGGEAERVFERRIGSLQRAVEAVSETLEDEASALRSSNATQADQIRLLTAQFSETDSLRAEVAELRAKLHSALNKNSEQSRLASQMSELQAEVETMREATLEAKRVAAAASQQTSDELAGLRRWRTDVVHPFIEASERSHSTQRGEMHERLSRCEADAAAGAALAEKVSPTAHAFVLLGGLRSRDDGSGYATGTQPYQPQTPGQVHEMERSLHSVGEEVSSLGGRLLQLTDVHNYSVGSLEADVARVRAPANPRVWAIRHLY